MTSSTSSSLLLLRRLARLIYNNSTVPYTLQELCRQRNLARIIIAGRIPGYREHSDEMTARGWTLGAQPAHGGPASLHASVSAVLESKVEQFLADLAASADAARATGRAVPDENLVVAGAALDVDAMTQQTLDGLLALAGLNEAGGGLPARMAPVNALLDAVPPELVERLLVEVILRVYRPTPSRPS